MTNPRFNRSQRINRFTAFWITVLFHACLIGGICYSSDSGTSIKDFLPDVVKEWFDNGGKETPVKPVKGDKRDNKRA